MMAQRVYFTNAKQRITIVNELTNYFHCCSEFGLTNGAKNSTMFMDSPFRFCEGHSTKYAIFILHSMIQKARLSLLNSGVYLLIMKKCLIHIFATLFGNNNLIQILALK
jgi:hypothetical protein